MQPVGQGRGLAALRRQAGAEAEVGLAQAAHHDVAPQDHHSHRPQGAAKRGRGDDGEDAAQVALDGDAGRGHQQAEIEPHRPALLAREGDREQHQQRHPVEQAGCGRHARRRNPGIEMAGGRPQAVADSVVIDVTRRGQYAAGRRHGQDRPGDLAGCGMEDAREGLQPLGQGRGRIQGLHQGGGEPEDRPVPRMGLEQAAEDRRQLDAPAFEPRETLVVAPGLAGIFGGGGGQGRGDGAGRGAADAGQPELLGQAHDRIGIDHAGGDAALHDDVADRCLVLQGELPGAVAPGSEQGLLTDGADVIVALSVFRRFRLIQHVVLPQAYTGSGSHRYLCA